ncbi:MAG: hypothetical protein ACFB0C_16925 [Leptolyngbyaceae cyanobacterium]
MVAPSPFTAAERLESLKAAALGGSAAAIVAVTLTVIRPLVLNNADWGLGLPITGLLGAVTLIGWAIAALSGALFALTYRYAVRKDTNPQLKGGVVLAFTLVRGLALVDGGSAIAQHYWPFAAASLESLLLFGVTGLLLEIAFSQAWIAPFQS